ncbi:MAG: hypothetical protein J6568_00305 [Snodgrassella sp.]|nr:hypothetical protein [Snodgrassella sp.]
MADRQAFWSFLKKVKFDTFAADLVFKQTVLPLNLFGTATILVEEAVQVTDFFSN